MSPRKGLGRYSPHGSTAGQHHRAAAVGCPAARRTSSRPVSQVGQRLSSVKLAMLLQRVAGLKLAMMRKLRTMFGRNYAEEFGQKVWTESLTSAPSLPCRWAFTR